MLIQDLTKPRELPVSPRTGALLQTELPTCFPYTAPAALTQAGDSHTTYTSTTYTTEALTTYTTAKPDNDILFITHPSSFQNHTVYTFKVKILCCFILLYVVQLFFFFFFFFLMKD